MSTTREQVLDALRRVAYPGFNRDIVSLGIVRGIRIDGDRVEVDLDPGSGGAAAATALERDATEAVKALPGVTDSRVVVQGAAAAPSSLRMAPSRPSVAAAGALDERLIPQVRHTIAVASGKGGVGKSTVAVNLAVALARSGASTGLLDADIYGPSIPLMMGIDEDPAMTPDRRLVPFERYGVRLMSLGFLVKPGAAVIWRGPMVMKAIEQLLRDVDWGELDYLIVDMPPGTGDAQLTLSQKVKLAGAVIVTTPQDVALADVRKGVAMFRKVEVPVLGIIENMSYFQCPGCDRRSEIFGHGGGRREAEKLGVPCLGEVPLDPAIRTGGDAGEPAAAVAPDSPHGRAFIEIAEAVRKTIPDKPADKSSIFDRFRKVRDPSNP